MVSTQVLKGIYHPRRRIRKGFETGEVFIDAHPYIAGLNEEQKSNVMKTVNKLLFDNLEEQYAKSFDTLKKWGYRKLEIHEDVLGFDTESYGWVAVHKKHSISGLFDEFATCRILKKKGYAVELIEESAEIASVDALIDGKLYEMKRVSSATNLPRAIEKQIRLAYKKADNVVLHIDQPIEKEVLVAALRKAIYNHKGIKNILLMWDDNIKLLSEKDILGSQW